jgi:hypothetical protein
LKIVASILSVISLINFLIAGIECVSVPCSVLLCITSFIGFHESIGIVVLKNF